MHGLGGSRVGVEPVQDFLLCCSGFDGFGVPLPPVGLQGRPGFGVVAAAVRRSFSLAVPQKHICSLRQEEPAETEDTFHFAAEFEEKLDQPSEVVTSSDAHITQSSRFSRAAMCSGESPWMLTTWISQWAFNSSWAISTLPEKAAQ